MILLDLSGTMYSTIMVELHKPENRNRPVQEDLILHMIYNSIREKSMSFKNDYGKMVICVDDKNYWRKDNFPHYKFKRKANRDKDGVDWAAVFTCLDKARDYIQEFFPYKFVRVERAEADDVIGVLAPKLAMEGEKVLIVSRDSDFGQLHKYPNVKQYSPVDRRYIEVHDADKFLKEKILRGDTGDSIPNFLSDDDAIASANKRQRPLLETKLETYLSTDISEFPEDLRKNFKRNQELIDFNFIPPDIKAAIIEEYEKPIKGSKMLLMQHLAQKKMRVMLGSITDF